MIKQIEYKTLYEVSIRFRYDEAKTLGLNPVILMELILREYLAHNFSSFIESINEIYIKNPYKIPEYF